VVALSAFLALLPGYGYRAAGEIMRAVDGGDLDAALSAVTLAHVQLHRDRETLASVSSAAAHLTTETMHAPGPIPVGALAHRLSVKPATLRKWERAGILTPVRDRAGHRAYAPEDVRDAQLAHLLRRGGHRLDHIATVIAQVRTAGGPEALRDSLADWRERLTARGRAMLTGAARLHDYLDFRDRNDTRPARGGDGRGAS
jgi:DNA-binding transcriptional MerR regulator